MLVAREFPQVKEPVTDILLYIVYNVICQFTKQVSFKIDYPVKEKGVLVKNQ